MLQSKVGKRPADAVPPRGRVSDYSAKDGRARRLRCLPIPGRIYAYSGNGNQLLWVSPRGLDNPKGDEE